MKPVLLDTGVIVALLDRSEDHHNACKRVISDLPAPLVTCEPVIAEACYLLRTIRGAAEAVLENVARGVFQIPFRLAAAAGGVRVVMRKYADVPIDLADACLIHLAEQLGTGRILTLDADFAVYRWRRNRAFDPLIRLAGAPAQR